MAEEDVEGRLLNKLFIHRHWEHSYIARRDAMKYVPREHAALADRIIDKLVREGLLAEYKKGDCIYLVIERRQDIRQRIAAFLQRMGME